MPESSSGYRTIDPGFLAGEGKTAAHVTYPDTQVGLKWRHTMPTVERPATLRPALKWAGGKRWQVPHLQAIWKVHSSRRLVEPFCGGLAVTLGLMPARALLNDANPHLINFYRWLQKGLRVDLPMENDEALFYEHRARFNALLATKRSANRDAAGLFHSLPRTP